MLKIKKYEWVKGRREKKKDKLRKGFKTKRKGKEYGMK